MPAFVMKITRRGTNPPDVLRNPNLDRNPTELFANPGNCQELEGMDECGRGPIPRCWLNPCRPSGFEYNIHPLPRKVNPPFSRKKRWGGLKRVAARIILSAFRREPEQGFYLTAGPATPPKAARCREPPKRFFFFFYGRLPPCVKSDRYSGEVFPHRPQGGFLCPESVDHMNHTKNKNSTANKETRWKLHPYLYPVPFAPEEDPPEAVLFITLGRREYYAPMTRGEAAGWLSEYYLGWPEDDKALKRALAPFGVTIPENIPDDRQTRRPILEKMLEPVPDGKLDRLLTTYIQNNLALLELFVAGANFHRRKAEARTGDTDEKSLPCLSE